MGKNALRYRNITLPQMIRVHTLISIYFDGLKGWTGLVSKRIFCRHIFFHIISWFKMREIEKDKKYTNIANYASQKFGIEAKSLLKYNIEARSIKEFKNGLKIEYEDNLKEELKKVVDEKRKKEIKKQYAEKLKEKFRKIDTESNEDMFNRAKLVRVYNHYEKIMNSINKPKSIITKKIKYPAIAIYDHLFEEFEYLEQKFGDSDKELKNDLTYKRLRSGNLSKISYKEYEKFTNELQKNIENSTKINKNMQYYRVEKALGFELSKTICKVIRQIELKFMKEDKKKLNAYLCNHLKRLIPLYGMQDIIERHRYVEEYGEIILKIGQEEKAQIEEKLTDWLTRYCTHSVLLEKIFLHVWKQVSQHKEKINFKPYEEEYNKLYARESFASQYNIEDDFLDKNFRMLMSIVEESNKKATIKPLNTTSKYVKKRL